MLTEIQTCSDGCMHSGQSWRRHALASKQALGGVEGSAWFPPTMTPAAAAAACYNKNADHDAARLHGPCQCRQQIAMRVLV